MRILFHCVYFPPEVGGLESHVYYLARALAERLPPESSDPVHPWLPPSILPTS